MITGGGHTQTRNLIFSAIRFGHGDRRIVWGNSSSVSLRQSLIEQSRPFGRKFGGNLPQRSDKAIEDLSRMFNPTVRGWLQYYGRYYRSALYPPLRHLDRELARWANRKYKKLRGHLRRATHWIARIIRRDPGLFAHWQMLGQRGSMAGAV